MDHELLVDDQIEEGKSLITQLVADGFDVTVAFWARPTNSDPWTFYIGSNSLQTMSLGEAFRAIYASMRRVPGLHLPLSDITLLDANDSVASAAIEVRNRHRARMATRYRGEELGGMPTYEVYIYPKNGVMSRLDVLSTVTGLMDRTGVLEPSRATLRDGTQIEAIPVGLQMSVPGAIQVEFRDIHTGMNRSISADEVASIL